MSEDLTLEDIINAYKHGLFPMADCQEGNDFFWYDPPLRGQLSIENLSIPTRLRRTVLQFSYDIRIDTAFEEVIKSCAEKTQNRPETWINQNICDIFLDLYEAGYAHSVEVRENDTLVGGLYGIALGGAFMGESMFSRSRDASKIALVHLCARLWQGGFSILDTQYTNPHLMQFGVYEIPRKEYLEKLFAALPVKADFLLSGQNEQILIRNYLQKTLE
ncbi:MAG: leucyl/phenylalanyl-tRNA--protein transferase [Alphaproteobacteria bacterium CG_4_9_14_3_um_filter_47_13]|nr:MAG: leucyl/phenylalanyl-tRNA--protein transferase [Alphaproteobacteria bacterium CG_4_9_14_3_um_filter_47_13]